MSRLRSMILIVLSATVLVGCGGGTVTPAAKQNGRYFVTDAGPADAAGAGYDAVSAPNDLGQIVGPGAGLGCSDDIFKVNGCYAVSPFVYTPGSGIRTLTRTGNLLGINNHGDAIGFDRGTSFVITQSGKIPLGTLGGQEAYAFGINDSGKVVGVSSTATSPTVFHAFLWQSGVISDLGTLPGYDSSHAYGISNSGTVAGYCSGNGKSAHAALWHDGRVDDLGTNIPGLSVAMCVNNLGDCAGYAGQFGLAAIAWHNGVPIDLGPGQAFGIDDNGTVVGMAPHSPVDETGGFRAYLWAEQKSIDLNTQIDPSIGWVLNVACGINSKGQISGVGMHNGASRVFLLTPQ